MEPIRGTYDLYDKEMMIHKEIVNLLKDFVETYNFTEIKTPIIEKVELFKRSTGESSDIVQKEMYDFKDKGGRDIVLRPELTAGVVRSFLSNKIYGKRQAQYKYYYYGEAFRYERPQKGRYRQFYQFGLEMFGDDTVYSDVEIVSLAYNIIDNLNLSSKTVLKVNTIGSSDERKAYNKILKEYFAEFKDELCDDCKNRLETNPLRILDCKIDGDQECIKNAPTLKSSLGEESLNKYNNILKLLNEVNIEFEEDDSLVRGLDYYNDIVFEFVYNNDLTLIGGGRYDKLIQELGNQDLPAIGFGVGIERIIEAFKQENEDLLEDFVHKIDILYAPLTDDAYPIILKSMDKLRNGGLICSCVYNKQTLKFHLKEALRNNAVYLVIIGEDEIKDGVVTVKNLLAETEEKVKIEEFEATLLGEMSHK